MIVLATRILTPFFDFPDDRILKRATPGDLPAEQPTLELRSISRCRRRSAYRHTQFSASIL